MTKKHPQESTSSLREPVHVLYGGADRYKVGTAQKLGKIARENFAEYAPTPVEFANVFDLKDEAGSLVFQRVATKLSTEPIEDFRIDFEDGYGFRSDAEEDGDAERAARELSADYSNGTITPFCGFRVKGYGKETRVRAKRTLGIFLAALLSDTVGQVPNNFVVTLPKVAAADEVKELCKDLKRIEKFNGLQVGSIRIEIVIEHPLAFFDDAGSSALKGLVDAAKGRCIAAHFGAYDYTASLGIAANHQDISHPACDFARHLMLVNLRPLNIRLADSVTTKLPIPIYKIDKPTKKQIAENRSSIHVGWRLHFDNVQRSMSAGFYQSWDLHPNQLVARFAAVYSFFLDAANSQANRLQGFLEKATKASVTGNVFDDAASAQGILNFFRIGIRCGALDSARYAQIVGLSEEELLHDSFSKIVASRN